VDRRESRRQESHPSPGDCTPRGLRDLCHRPRGSGSAGSGFSRAPRGVHTASVAESTTCGA
jgi:hypothetical protein